MTQLNTGHAVEVATHVSLIEEALFQEGRKAVKPQFGKLRLESDRDLDSEVAKMVPILKSDKSDWKLIVTELQKVQHMAKLVASGDAHFSRHALVANLGKLVPCLQVQLLCLRSQVTREAYTSTMMLAEALGDDFELAAVRLLNKEALVKLMHSGKSVLAEYGFMSVVGILHCVCSHKLLQRLASEMTESRSNSVQEKGAAVFLFLFLTLYPKDVIKSQASHLSTYMKHCLENANVRCRETGRKAFLVWQHVDKHSANRVFN